MQKKLTILFAFAIFVLLVGWSITPAQAHIKFCESDLEHKHCTGNDGETPMIVPTVARWGGDITRDSDRLCFASQVVTNGDGGFYTCTAGSPEVNYALGDGVFTARKGVPSLCERFEDGIDLTPDRLYGYNWADNCEEDGRCTIRISNWFSEEATGEGFIRLVAIAVADAIEQTGNNSFKDANPFVDSLNLNVDEINITFYAAGSNKRIAECLYEPDNVTFHSDPM